MRELSNLPNKEGFEFIAILKDNSKIKTKVTKDQNGLHRFKEFSDAIGWFPLDFI